MGADIPQCRKDHRHSGQRPTGEYVVSAATEGEGEDEGAKVGQEGLLLLPIRFRAAGGGVEAVGELLL